MRAREKIFGIGAGALAVVVLAFMVVQKLLVQPAGALDVQAGQLRKDISRLAADNARKDALSAKLEEFTDRTFGDDEAAVSEQVRARLVDLVERSGLGGREFFSMQPFEGLRKKEYREIGRTVSARGKLNHVVNFLYLLYADPHLHRVDNVRISPLLQTGEVSVQLRYSTLIVEPMRGGKTPATRSVNDLPGGRLDDEWRKLYDAITARDLFRPYIKRRPEPAPSPEPVAGPAPPRRRDEPRRPSNSRYRVVSLSSWAGNPEVVVEEESDRRRVYKTGDSLAGGQIVMVDYRMLPSPEKPEILSPSRVIVRIGPEYWAVEVGRTLGEKRLLKVDELPAGLHSEGKPLPATAPGGQEASAGEGEQTGG